jgi:predicted membrane protein
VSRTADRTGIGRRLVPSWPLIVGLAVFIRALAQPTALLNDPDTYLHIAAGRWMLAHAALPVHDPFSHSLAGAVWVPHEWLAELVLATVYDAAGWSGLVLLTATPSPSA